MAKKQTQAAGGQGLFTFWNLVFVFTMTGIGFGTGAAYGRHTVMVAPSTDLAAVKDLPKDEEAPGAIPDETFSAFDRIPDARGKRVSKASEVKPQVVLAPGTEVAATAAPEGSAAAAVPAPTPVAEVAKVEPAPAPLPAPAAKPAPVAKPAPAAEQVLANATPSASPARKVARPTVATPTFEIVAAGARTWEEANQASRSLQDGGLKTTVSAVRDEKGGRRWLVHVQGTGDQSEKQRQQQLIRRLLSSR